MNGKPELKFSVLPGTRTNESFHVFWQSLDESAHNDSVSLLKVDRCLHCADARAIIEPNVTETFRQH